MQSPRSLKSLLAIDADYTVFDIYVFISIDFLQAELNEAHQKIQDPSFVPRLSERIDRIKKKRVGKTNIAHQDSQLGNNSCTKLNCWILAGHCSKMCLYPVRHREIKRQTQKYANTIHCQNMWVHAINLFCISKWTGYTIIIRHLYQTYKIQG